MRWRGTLVGAFVLCLAAYGALAGPKQRRVWIDPPADLPAAAAVDPRGPVATLPPVDAAEPREPVAALPAVDPEVEATGSVTVWSPAASVGDPQPRFIEVITSPRSSCTTRSYTVLSGAVVHVHGC